MICLLPNSLYGPNDDFSLEGSHVLSALVRKIHDAHQSHQPEVLLWGSGKPCREFLFSADAADASVFAMKNRDKLENRFYNLGTGQDFSIQELAQKIAFQVGFKGQIKFDSRQPDGAPRKLLDSSRFLNLGWKAKTSLDDGIRATYEWFLKK